MHAAVQSTGNWSNPDFPFNSTTLVPITSKSDNSRLICPATSNHIHFKTGWNVLYGKDFRKVTGKDQKHLGREKDVSKKKLERVGQSNKNRSLAATPPRICKVGQRLGKKKTKGLQQEKLDHKST